MRAFYLTSDDESPVQAAVEQVPFHCTAEARRCHKGQSVPAQHRFGADRRDDKGQVARMVEDRYGAGPGFWVLQPTVCEPVITAQQVNPTDMQKSVSRNFRVLWAYHVA